MRTLKNRKCWTGGEEMVVHFIQTHYMHAQMLNRILKTGEDLRELRSFGLGSKRCSDKWVGKSSVRGTYGDSQGISFRYGMF